MIKYANYSINESKLTQHFVTSPLTLRGMVPVRLSVLHLVYQNKEKSSKGRHIFVYKVQKDNFIVRNDRIFGGALPLVVFHVMSHAV